jgi:S1-C subfamily serine protease
MRKVFVVMLIACIASGCAASNVYMRDNKIEKNASFVIVPKGDQLGVSNIILDEIAKRGYRVTMSAFSQSQPEQATAPAAKLGSGFFISENGLMLTNAHIASEASNIIVRKNNGDTFKAEVVIIDNKNDIAILKPQKLATVSKWFSLATSNKVQIGDKIFVIGYPLSDILGDHPRVTEGIISADVGVLNDPTRFQISASIQPGNSGGPIINDNYEAVAIATEKLSDFYAMQEVGSIPQNVNFGVKTNYAQLLFNNKINAVVENKKSSISSINDAIEATVLIATNVEKIPVSVSEIKKEKKIIIEYSYNFTFDVFHYTFTNFNMWWIDYNTGEIVGSASFAGDSPLNYQAITKSVLKDMFEKAGLK